MRLLIKLSFKLRFRAHYNITSLYFTLSSPTLCDFSFVVLFVDAGATTAAAAAAAAVMMQMLETTAAAVASVDGGCSEALSVDAKCRQRRATIPLSSRR